MSSGICLLNNPTISVCCRVLRRECIFHLVRISQTTPVDCRHRSVFSDIGRWPCPKSDTVHRNWTKRWANRRDWNSLHSLDPNGRATFSNIFRFAHPKCEHSHRNCPTQLNYFVDWNCSRTRSCCDLSVFSSICRCSIPTISMFCHRWRWPIDDCHSTRPHRWFPIYGRKLSSRISHRTHPKFLSIYRQLNGQEEKELLSTRRGQQCILVAKVELTWTGQPFTIWTEFDGWHGFRVAG